MNFPISLSEAIRFVRDAIQGHYWINWEKYCGFWRAYRLTQNGKKENDMIARRKLSAHSSLIPPSLFPMQYWLGYILWQWGFRTLYVTQLASSMAVVAWGWSLKGPSVDNTQNRTESYNGRLRTSKSETEPWGQERKGDRKRKQIVLDSLYHNVFTHVGCDRDLYSSSLNGIQTWTRRQ